MITVLCGGVGAARFVRGLALAVEPSLIVGIVNTADDTVMHGLAISPDLDTVTYTLAGAIDADRGWGLANETWQAMDALGRFDAVRPTQSHAGEHWFNLGDRDLATHMYRTARLAEGASLTTVTAEITRAFGLAMTLLPMTDDQVRTIVSVDDLGDVAFQEYFVRLRHSVAVRSVRFEGAHAALLTDAAKTALTQAEVVIIAPSNPLVSIAPIRALAGVDQLLAARRSSVVAVSPIVGGAALKGPADRMLVELGMESSVVSVAELYAPIAETLVIDHADAHLAAHVERAGMRCVVTDTIMRSADIAGELARQTVAASSTVSARLENS